MAMDSSLFAHFSLKAARLCSARRAQRQQLQLLLLLLLFLASATTSAASWRPTPLHASAPTASLSGSGASLGIQLRYKTWDGHFLDVVELAAGMTFCLIFSLRASSGGSSCVRVFFLFLLNLLKNIITNPNRNALLRRAREALGPFPPASNHGGAPDPRGRRQDP